MNSLSVRAWRFWNVGAGPAKGPRSLVNSWTWAFSSPWISWKYRRSAPEDLPWLLALAFGPAALASAARASAGAVTRAVRRRKARRESPGSATSGDPGDGRE